jgi:hypothetical protein
MLRTYQALLKGNRLEWVGEAPDYEGDRPVSVQVTMAEPEALSNEAACGQQMAAILEKLAERGAVGEIQDPVAWQRELRQDRPLPGRENECS